MTDFVAIPRDCVPGLRAAVADMLTERQRDFDNMRGRAAAAPADQLVADQVAIAARRLAEALMVDRELEAAVPGAPLPF